MLDGWMHFPLHVLALSPHLTRNCTFPLSTLTPSHSSAMPRTFLDTFPSATSPTFQSRVGVGEGIKLSSQMQIRSRVEHSGFASGKTALYPLLPQPIPVTPLQWLSLTSFYSQSAGIPSRSSSGKVIATTDAAVCAAGHLYILSKH